MKADVKTLHDLTSTDVRYLVPRYQRPYVWTEEKHWEPLWSDIETAFERLEKDASRDHFLGAIVLKEGNTPPGDATRYEVIDGQQRLTTTQIVIAAAANVAFESGVEKVGRRLTKMVLNDEDSAEGDELFKLWPTAQDRVAFRLIASPGGPPPDAKNDPNNTIQEAYDYFRRKVSEFTVGDGSDPEATAERLETLRSVLAGVFKIVAIRLEGSDEAQVIFETLNARGTPLLALDLVKNTVFQAADLDEAGTEALHDEVWDPELGRSYWREEVRQGRLTRPRAELFLIHWMTMKLGLRGLLTEPIRSDRVFQTFSAEILKDPKGPGPDGLIRELARDARTMRNLDEIDPSTAEGRFLRTTDYLDTSVFFPVILYLFIDPKVTPQDRLETLQILESVQVRRSLLALTGKSYSQVAISVLREIGAADSESAPVVRGLFERSEANRARWPGDAEIRERLVNRPIYGWVSRGKLAGILAEMEREMRMDNKTEDIPLGGRALSIEHVMPQTWEKNWLLDNSTPETIEERNELVQTLGNLTLVTGQLNSTLSNQSWVKKRERFQKHSLLLLNRSLAEHETWSDIDIRSRGTALAEQIIALWPGPENESPGDGSDGSERKTIRSGGEFSEAELIDAFESGTDRFRSMLIDLAAQPRKWKAFGEVEVGLGWSPGSLPAVLAGFTRINPDLNGRRPFDTGEDQNDERWIRMNEELAKVVHALDPKTTGPREPTERQRLRQEFLEGLLETAASQTPLHASVSARTDDWVAAGAGTSGVHWLYRARTGETSVELAFEGPDAELNQQRLGSIKADQANLEQKFGASLEWERVDGRKRCSIVKTFDVGGYESPRDDWKGIFEVTSLGMVRLEELLRRHVAQIVARAKGCSS